MATSKRERSNDGLRAMQKIEVQKGHSRMKPITYATLALLLLTGTANAYDKGRDRWRPINRMSHFFAQKVGKPKDITGKQLKPCVTCGRNLWLPKKREQCSVCDQMQGSMPVDAWLLHLWQISQHRPWDKRWKGPGNE